MGTSKAARAPALECMIRGMRGITTDAWFIVVAILLGLLLLGVLAFG
jgi:hypothetical protein